MARTEQSIRVSAKGEFGQLQRGLKDLQGDLKNVLGEIDKGARKGGIFDDSSLRALDIYKKRLQDTMGELDKELTRQNDKIDRLHERMERASGRQRANIEEQIKAREKELDVIRRQLLAVERMYQRRTSEAGGYEIQPPRQSGTSAGSAMVPAAMTGALGKAMGVVGTIGKFALGLAGLSSLVALGQRAYQLAYERQVESLDLAQRLRGHGFQGSNISMYNQVSNVGLRDNMGYSARESWSVQDAYSRQAGKLGSEGQFAIQKFSRGYGLDATETAGAFGSVKQLGGMVQPKQFADMIAGSVSQSGMLPRIHEVMQAHTGLLQNLNTTFKDGASRQILAYQTVLDKLGTEKGMTRLTGAQGANIIGGLGGIFQPGNDKWKWTGIAALQNYDPKKYGGMGLYDLEASFEQGLLNPDNLPAMSKHLREQSGGNTEVFKRLMQSWLTEGGFSATKGQINELHQVTNGFTAFDEAAVNKVLKISDSTDSGNKYDEERKGEQGQNILQVDAKFDNALAQVGQKYLLEPITSLKSDFTGIINALDGDKGLPGIWDAISNSSPLLKGILAAVAISAGINVGRGVADVAKFFKGRGGGGAGGAVDDVARGATNSADDVARGLRGATSSADDVARGLASEAPEIGNNLIRRALTGNEDEILKSLSKGNPAARETLEQVLRATGDMDAVKHVASGKATASELIDMVSNGDTKVYQELLEQFGKTGDIKGTLARAKELASNADSAISGVSSTADDVVKTGGNWFTKFFKKSSTSVVDDVAQGASSSVDDLARAVANYTQETARVSSIADDVARAATSSIDDVARGSSGFLKTAGKITKKIPLIGAAVDFGINKFLMKQSTEEAATRAVGSGLGGWGGGAAGAAIGTAIFPGVGTVVGGLIGGIGGSIAGDRVGKGVFDYATGEHETPSEVYKNHPKVRSSSAKSPHPNNRQEILKDARSRAQSSEIELNRRLTHATAKLIQFSDSGTLDIDGLSTNGLQKLEEMREKGLIQFTDLKAGSSATLQSFSSEGKAKLLALQEQGLISIGGLQKDGTAQITALNKEGKTALVDLQKSGIVQISDFNTTGKLRVTSLSEEGAKRLLELQKNGSASLLSMDTTTSTQLTKMKEDTSSKMADIVKEHKTFGEKFTEFFEPLTSNIGNFFKDFWKNLWGRGDSDYGSVGNSYDVRQMSSVSASQLDSKFGGVLKGAGAEFVAAGHKYGIDPAFLAAVAMHETGNGSSAAAKNKNNVGGMMGKDGLMTFKSLEAGIDAMASNLKRLYIDKGLVTPEQIQKKYAPIGAANDPTGLNKHWVNGVTKYYSGFGVQPAFSQGGGFFNNWQSRVTSEFGEWRGNRAHGGLDIDGNQGDPLEALAGGKLAFLNMDDGGKYDADGKKNTRSGGTELGIRMADGSMYYYSHLSNVNPDLLNRWQSGERDISIGAGDWLGNLGGDVGKPGSGYSTTGSHLHLGYLDKNGNTLDPRKLLNNLSVGDSDIGTSEAWKDIMANGAASVASQQVVTREVKVSVDVNLKGDGAKQLNGMTTQALKALIQQTVVELQRQKLAMNPTARG